MGERDHTLALGDAELLARCEVHTHRSSGPGGQHRNKVSSAVRLVHQPTGIAATATESRSQHENRRRALRRLRMHLACQVREPVDPLRPEIPPVVSGCLSAPRRPGGAGRGRLAIGRKDARFWQVGAFLLDVLDAAGGRLAAAARGLGITTSNLASVLRADRHLLTAAQAVRKRHGLGAIR